MVTVKQFICIGWTPSNFVSSRSEKRNNAQQRPEDFMDEEDLEVFGIAPRQIVTTEPFAGEREDDGEKVRKRVREHNLLAPLEDIIRPTRMTIGMRLLNKMGWKEGQGIGPRITRDAGVKLYGCARAPTQEITDDVATGDLSFAPRDVEAFHFTPKDDFKGIGYKGLDPSAALHKQSAKENKKLMGMSGQV
jgi:G patch domain-containing protein 1